MSESLVLRVKRLISSGANSVVDAMENAAPEALMREAIREVDRATDDVRDELVRTVAGGHHANRRLSMIKEKLEELNEKACVAVAQERDDLAKVALSRQIDIEGQMPGLQTAIKDAAEKQSELDGFVAALGRRKAEMEADLAAFIAARKEAVVMNGGDPSGNGRSSVERRAENAQNTFERAFAGSTGYGSSVRLDRDTMSKLDELEKVSRDVRISQRLEAIKSMRQAI